MADIPTDFVVGGVVRNDDYYFHKEFIRAEVSRFFNELSRDQFKIDKMGVWRIFNYFNKIERLGWQAN